MGCWSGTISLALMDFLRRAIAFHLKQSKSLAANYRCCYTIRLKSTGSSTASSMQEIIQLVTGTENLVSGQICSMDDQHLNDYLNLWQPMIAAAGLADLDWPWEYKLRQAGREERFEAYALEVDELTQGLLFLETQWHRSGLPQRYPLVYVQAIASAPWNRISLEDPPYFLGVGRSLLLFSRRRSEQLGYKGRVGLHALPSSEGFYHRANMPDYGPDPDKEGLIYFEYGATQR